MAEQGRSIATADRTRSSEALTWRLCSVSAFPVFGLAMWRQGASQLWRWDGNGESVALHLLSGAMDMDFVM